MADIELEDLVSRLRPVGVGCALDIPQALKHLFKAVALFQDGSVGILWHHQNMVTFASANDRGEFEGVTSDVVMVGKALYVKVHT